MNTLGQRIRQLRKQRDLSQRALADKVGISRQALNIIEKGKGTPTLPTLLTLGEALEADAEAELVPLLIESLRATQKKPGPPTQRSRGS
jgi:transcriptional regulator with XRE-family HTH domain